MDATDMLKNTTYDYPMFSKPMTSGEFSDADQRGWQYRLTR